MPQKVITHGSVVCLPSLTEQPWAPQSVQHSLNPLYAILPHDKGPGVTLEEELDDQGGGLHLNFLGKPLSLLGTDLPVWLL